MPPFVSSIRSCAIPACVGSSGFDLVEQFRLPPHPTPPSCTISTPCPALALPVQVKVMKRVRDIREQLLGLMDRTEIELSSNLGDHDAIKKAIAAGFFYNTARLRKDGAYRTIKNPQTIHLHPSSGLTKMEVGCFCSLMHCWSHHAHPLP